MGKRANGEGSIYRRKQGQWVAVISLGTGRRKYFYCRSQAEAVLTLQQAQHARFIWNIDDNPKRNGGNVSAEMAQV